MNDDAQQTAAEAQHALVIEHLERRERIAAETRAHLAELDAREPVDPLAAVDPAVREAAEDAFYARHGKRRYKTSDGRTLFLTPEEIAQRRRARGQRGRGGRSSRKSSRTYGPAADEQRRRMVTWGFNIAAIVLALIVVFVILH